MGMEETYAWVLLKRSDGSWMSNFEDPNNPKFEQAGKRSKALKVHSQAAPPGVKYPHDYHRWDTPPAIETMLKRLEGIIGNKGVF